MTWNDKRIVCSAAVAALAAVLGTWGCGAETTGFDTGFEAFKAQSTKVVDGKEIYVVQWDLAIPSLEELQAYYQSKFGDSEHQTAQSPLLVNQVASVDDVWDPTTVQNLTYCVTTDFAGDYARAQAEMQAATDDWETLVNVRFIYDSSQDGNCDNTNGSVTFSVRPWTSGGACAFFPSGGGCVARTVVMDFNDFDTDPNWPVLAPNLTTTGVFRHELGHVLGFRHEHTNPASGTCFEDSNWRALTNYDPSSVMHYQWCNGVLASDLSLTDLDLDGAIGLYGLAADLVDATSIL